MPAQPPKGRLRFHSKAFSFLLNLLPQLHRNLRIHQTLQDAVQQTRRFFRADGSILFFQDPVKKCMRMIRSKGLEPAIARTLYATYANFSRPASKEKLARAFPKLIYDLQRVSQKRGWASVICTPLRPDGKSIGLLLLLSRKLCRYSSEEASFLTAIADRMAEVLHRSFTHEKLKHQLREALTLLHMERSSRGFLDRLLSTSVDPILITDPEGHITLASKGAERYFGASQKDLRKKSLSDFCAAGKAEAQRILKVLRTQESLRNDQIELIDQDGQKLTALLSGSLLRDDQGNCVGALALMKDITGLKKYLNHIHQAEESYQKLFDSVNDAIFSLNRDGFFTTFNRTLLKMTGYSEKEMRSFHFSKIVHPEDLGSMADDFDRVMAGEDAPERYKFRMVNKEGGIIYVEGNLRRAKDKDKIVGILGVLRDITEQVKLEKELLELSITDGLTGLYNLRHFYTEMDKEMERSRRQKIPLSLLLFDLDGFKAYNDIHGHLEGDQALKRVAEAVRGAIRKMDSAYRYGGDEFTVILPGAKKEQGLRVAERIRKAVKKLPEMNEITLSIGLVEFAPHLDLTAMIKRADEAMYAAKKMGGDQIFTTKG
jgi:diguanylate cyclase (GGDEF)-like protein/PAS domain S-box-containing protein